MDSSGRKDLEIIKLLYGPDSSPSEIELAISILHSRNVWDSQVKQVMEEVEGSAGLREWALLQQVIASCSDAVLTKYYKHWTSLLTQALKVNKDEGVHCHLCGGVSALLERAHNSPKAMPDFTKQKLPLLLQAILCFSLAPTSLQLPAIRVAALCHAWFALGQNQSRTALLKWAETAIFALHIPLSIEGARLMALLCHHSNQKWGQLVDNATGMLGWTLEQIYLPNKKAPKGKSAQLSGDTVLQLPRPLPVVEPERTSCLLQLVDQFSRTLSTSLLLPPDDHAHLPSVPVEKILAVILHGLRRHPLPGHTVECRVLEAALPIICTSLMNVLGVLLRTCQAHLLLYAPYLRLALMDELHLAQTQKSSVFLAAVFRVSLLWVGVAKDYDPALIKTLLQALLDLSEHAQTRFLQLQTLCEVLEVVGSTVQESSLITVIQQLSFEKLTAQTNSEEVLILLRLLVTCVRSRGVLCPPLGPVLQLLTDLSCSHPDKKVQSTCACVLSQCSLLMHPSVPPLPTGPPPIPHSTNSTTMHTPLLAHQPRPFSKATLPVACSSLSRSKSSSTDTNTCSTQGTSVSEGMTSQTHPEFSQKRKRSITEEEDVDKRPRRETQDQTASLASGSEQRASLPAENDGPLRSSSSKDTSDEAQSVELVQMTTEQVAAGTSTEMPTAVDDDEVVLISVKRHELVSEHSSPIKEEIEIGSDSDDDNVSGAELFIDESSDASGYEDNL